MAQLEEAGATCVVPISAEYDLRTEAAVRRLFGAEPADAVIHLAARVGGIGANRAHPAQFIYDNVMMGTLVLEYARRDGVEKYLQIGSVCSYPKSAPVPFREERLWDGYPEETNAAYGIAKRALLAQAQAYQAEYGMKAVTLISANLYGPHAVSDLETSHVIPAMVRKMIDAEAAGEPIVLWGDGSPSREFLHVDDCARAILLAIERYDGADPVNVGSGEETTIAELAGKLASLTGFTGEIRWDTSKPNGQLRRVCDVRRARERFGFKAEISLDDGLADTVRWYRTALERAA